MATRGVWPIAFSFAEWRCNRCRNVVQWADAVAVDTPELFGVFHADCWEEVA